MSQWADSVNKKVFMLGNNIIVTKHMELMTGPPNFVDVIGGLEGS